MRPCGASFSSRAAESRTAPLSQGPRRLFLRATCPILHSLLRPCPCRAAHFRSTPSPPLSPPPPPLLSPYPFALSVARSPRHGVVPWCPAVSGRGVSRCCPCCWRRRAGVSMGGLPRLHRHRRAICVAQCCARPRHEADSADGGVCRPVCGGRSGGGSFGGGGSRSRAPGLGFASSVVVVRSVEECGVGGSGAGNALV